MQEFEITLEFSRETKGTVVYESEGEGAEIRTLYIAKSAFENARGPFPARIVVSVMEAE